MEGSDEADYIVARCEEDAYKTARAKHGEDVKLIQESDVLDTWFSRYASSTFRFDRWTGCLLHTAAIRVGISTYAGCAGVDSSARD